MAESDVLLTIAEVAIAFAGFSSLVGILGQRSSLDDPRVLGTRMRGMLLSSLIVTAFAILPGALGRYAAAPELVWRWSSLGLLAASAMYFVWVLLSFRSLGRAAMTRTRVQRFVILPTVILTLTSLTALLVMNVILARPWIYLTALLLVLFQSGFTFCHIVFSFLPRVRLDGLPMRRRPQVVGEISPATEQAIATDAGRLVGTCYALVSVGVALQNRETLVGD